MKEESYPIEKKSSALSHMSVEIDIDPESFMQSVWNDFFGKEQTPGKPLRADGTDELSEEAQRKILALAAFSDAIGPRADRISNIDLIHEWWREQFGDEKPTATKVGQAALQGLFMNTDNLYLYGGVKALQKRAKHSRDRRGKAHTRPLVASLSSVFQNPPIYRPGVNQRSDSEDFIPRLENFEPDLSKVDLDYEDSVSEPEKFEFDLSKVDNLPQEKPQADTEPFFVLSPEGHMLPIIMRPYDPEPIEVQTPSYPYKTIPEKTVDKWPDIKTEEDLVKSWKNLFGDLEPSPENFNKACVENGFITPAETRRRFGSEEALARALRYGANEDAQAAAAQQEKVNQQDRIKAATLWAIRFGKRVPFNEETAKEEHAKGNWFDADFIERVGGIEALAAEIENQYELRLTSKLTKPKQTARISPPNVSEEKIDRTLNVRSLESSEDGVFIPAPSVRTFNEPPKRD